MIDALVAAAGALPEEYASRTQALLCNDCEVLFFRSQALRFHCALQCILTVLLCKACEVRTASKASLSQALGRAPRIGCLIPCTGSNVCFEFCTGAKPGALPLCVPQMPELRLLQHAAAVTGLKVPTPYHMRLIIGCRQRCAWRCESAMSGEGVACLE